MKTVSSGLRQQLLQACSQLSGPPFLAGTRKESSADPHHEKPVGFTHTHRKATQYGGPFTYSFLQFLLLAHTRPLDINQTYHLIFLLGFCLPWLISREAGVGCDPSCNCSQIPFCSAVSVQEKSLMSSCFCCFRILVTDFKVAAHESCEKNSPNSL